MELAIVIGVVLLLLALVRRRPAIELAKRLEAVDDPAVAANSVDVAIRNNRRDQVIARKVRGGR